RIRGGPDAAAIDQYSVDLVAFDVFDRQVGHHLHSPRRRYRLATWRRETGFQPIIVAGAGIEQGGFPIGETGREDRYQGCHQSAPLFGSICLAALTMAVSTFTCPSGRGR